MVPENLVEEDLVAVEAGHVAPADRHLALTGQQLAADQAQQGGLAAAAAAHDGHHLTAFDGEVDAAQDFARAVRKVHVAQAHQVFFRFRNHDSRQARRKIENG